MANNHGIDTRGESLSNFRQNQHIRNQFENWNFQCAIQNILLGEQRVPTYKKNNLLTENF